MKIEGRTIAISGGSSGLGRACVLELVKAGGNAVILDLNEQLGLALVQQVGSVSAKFIFCDVTDTESIASAVEASMAWIRQTGKPLGGIIPAAGVGKPALMLDKSLTPLPLSSLDFILSINLHGTLDLVRQFLPYLASVSPILPSLSSERETPPRDPDPERGLILLVSSAAAYDGQTGQVAYAASKGALSAATLPMARDLSRFGIRVVTVAPSLFDSAMTARLSPKVRQSLIKALEFPKRPGRPEEFAALVRHAFENPMLNGVVIRLDGATRMPSKL